MWILPGKTEKLKRNGVEVNYNPGTRHWQNIKQIFRYLQGTMGACLKYDNNRPFLEIYCDAEMPR